MQTADPAVINIVSPFNMAKQFEPIQMATDRYWFQLMSKGNVILAGAGQISQPSERHALGGCEMIAASPIIKTGPHHSRDVIDQENRLLLPVMVGHSTFPQNSRYDKRSVSSSASAFDFEHPLDKLITKAVSRPVETRVTASRTIISARFSVRTIRIRYGYY
jgi:hypothetical protein